MAPWVTLVLWEALRFSIRQPCSGQGLEIFKPEPQRKYGYYCLPVLAGDRLVSRLDLKADRGAGRLQVLARHDEVGGDPAADGAATRFALRDLADALGLRVARAKAQESE